MARRELDDQLIESVVVRRARMRDALLWGPDRRARACPDLLARVAVGLVLAAVGAAGCVGWAFLQTLLAAR